MMNARGFIGPLKVFGDEELETVNKIHDEWGKFWPAIRDRLVTRGFVEPSERICFIWLAGCFALAKHDRILEIVTSAIGPKVLLYGMTVWHGRNEVLQLFHRDPEALSCEESVNVVLGAHVQAVTLSNRFSERFARMTLVSMQAIEEQSLEISNLDERAAFVERSFASKVKRSVRTPNVGLATLSGQEGEAVFLPGRTIYRLGEAPGESTGLLLHFISAECKLRDPRSMAWGANSMLQSVYMPPALLVAGDRSKLRASNDVRLGLVREEAWSVTGKRGRILEREEEQEAAAAAEDKDEENRHGYGPTSRVRNVTVFPESGKRKAWRDVGMWRSQEVGAVSTEVLAAVWMEHFLLGRTEEALQLDFREVKGEQVMVVVSEGMLYFRAMEEQQQEDGEFFRFYELLELKPGSSVRFSEKLLHALVPSSLKTAFVSIRWTGFENEEDDPSSIALSTQALQGRTITLSSGQAYDPDNVHNCDVIIVLVDGNLLQVLPSNTTVQAFDVLLIPAGQACVLWNIGRSPVKLFAMHLCRFGDGTINDSTSFGASGKVF